MNLFRYSVSKEIQSFAIENYNEMFGYINIGRINIRIHGDIERKMWFGVDMKLQMLDLILNTSYKSLIINSYFLVFIFHYCPFSLVLVVHRVEAFPLSHV